MTNWGTQLDELMAHRYRELVAFARMLTGDHAHAEDTVQDALIETFSKRRSFPTSTAAESYVRRVMASRAIDRGRRRTAEHRALTRVGATDIDHSASPELLAEHSTDVAAALTLLTDRERACVVLRYIEHLSVDETASTLRLSAGSVKRYVYDGIQKMSAALNTSTDPGLRDTARVDHRRA